MPLSIKDVMERMPDSFLPEKAEGVEAVIQFEFTGEEEGYWVARISEGACHVTAGEVNRPTLTLTSDSQDYLDVLSGKLNGTKAFMQGKLRLIGDLGLAMQMLSYFDLSE